jgi:signal transduction histidine kinase
MIKTVRDRLEVRHAERERIARDLHDTLLQGIQGLILFFQTTPDRIPKTDPYHDKVNQALDRAHRVMVEGRNRVRDLRASDPTIKDLGEAFAALAKELEEDWPAEFRIQSEGVQKEMDLSIRDEVYLIGREAILNAFHHARASQIEVCLDYDARQFRLCVRDNGMGFDSGILASSRAGHWGLLGMQERAAGIGGHLETSTQPGAGTQVKLTVPSGIAYAGSCQFTPAWFKRHIKRRALMAASDRKDG